MATHLDAGHVTPGTSTSIATANTVSPTSGNIVLMGFMMRFGNGPTATPTVSGLGLTWTVYGPYAGEASRRLYAAVGVGTPSSGVVTVTAGGSDDFFQLLWTISEESGRDTSSPVVQSTGAAYTSATTSMSANFGSAMQSGSYGWSASFQSGGSSTPTPRTNWTTLNHYSSDPNGYAQYRAGTDTAVSVTWAQSLPGAIIGLELAEAAGSGYTLTADGFTVVVTPTDAAFEIVVPGDPGVITADFTDATLSVDADVTLAADAFAVVTTFADAGLDTTLAAAPGVLSVAFAEATLLYNAGMAAEPFAVSAAFTDATLRANHTLAADEFTVVVDVADATLTFETAITLAAAPFVVTILGGPAKLSGPGGLPVRRIRGRRRGWVF